jgi:hypothetical protein
MRALLAAAIVGSGALLGASLAKAQQSTPAAAAPAGPDDRLFVSANGSTLEDADDGYGGLVRWLHYFSADALLGLGAEYQSIGDAHWTVGTITGTATRTARSGARSSLYGEVTWGKGRVSDRPYTHAIEALGFIQSWLGGFGLQLEDRQIDVDQTHGNLPKVALSYAWNPRVLTTASYSNSITGNLGTELYALRLDLYGKNANLLTGAAYGDATPAIFNIQTGVVTPAQRLREGYLGVSFPFTAGEFSAVGDYLKLADSERITLTLSFNFYLR